MEVVNLSLSKNYVELYSNYFSEIDDIKKSLKMFKIKKNTALKLGIFASDEEVAELEEYLLGVTPKVDIDKNKEVNLEYIENAKKELSKDENLADILDILEDDDSSNPAKDNDMVQIYKFSNGDMYIGRLLDGKMIGIGSYIFAPGEDDEGTINTEYIGNFVNGIREGKGTYTYSNGNEYIGNFKGNKSNGVGRMKYINGDEYLGNWSDGKKEGTGIYTWENGFMYIGNFVDGKMDGEGSCFNSKGELVYSGEWLKGQIHGKGKYIWNKNKYYEGDFVQGEKHGYGSFYLNSQPVYTGTWKYDKPDIFDRTFEEIFDNLEF